MSVSYRNDVTSDQMAGSIQRNVSAQNRANSSDAAQVDAPADRDGRSTPR